MVKASEPVVLPTSTASLAVAPAAVANDKIGVNLVTRPAEFVFDGEIAEWNNFVPVDTGSDPEQPDEPREQEPVAALDVRAIGPPKSARDGHGVRCVGRSLRGPRCRAERPLRSRASR